MTTIGERISQEIAASPGKSLTGCAAYAGLSKSTLSELVSGRSKSSTKLHLIAEYLGVTSRWLETGRPPKNAESKSYGRIADEDASLSYLPRSSFKRVPVVGTASLGLDG